jgi:hypothetical protein
MLNLLAQLSQWAHAAPAVRGASIPNNLMERAEARAGLNPHQAQELRLAACAYLSVVR